MNHAYQHAVKLHGGVLQVGGQSEEKVWCIRLSLQGPSTNYWHALLQTAYLGCVCKPLEPSTYTAPYIIFKCAVSNSRWRDIFPAKISSNITSMCYMISLTKKMSASAGQRMKLFSHVNKWLSMFNVFKCIQVYSFHLRVQAWRWSLSILEHGETLVKMLMCCATRAAINNFFYPLSTFLSISQND